MKKLEKKSIKDEDMTFTAIKLLNSMVEAGEKHSDESKRIVSEALRTDADPNTSTVLKVSNTDIDEKDRPLSPFPLSVIPNHMGINLCSVDYVSWNRQEDGQLIDLSIKFIPHNPKIKVFKLHTEDHYYIYSGKNKDDAKQALFDDIGTATICDIQEIPESEWDKRTVNMWEGNDFEKKPYKVSIRDNMSGDTPIQICTSNIDF